MNCLTSANNLRKISAIMLALRSIPFMHRRFLRAVKHTTTKRREPPLADERCGSFVYCFFAVFLLTAASCGRAAGVRPAQSPAIETAAPTDMYELSVSIEEQVLLDEQGVKITALSIYDTSESPILSILIENNSENDVTITLWNALVNGKHLAFDDTNCVVEAGKTATAGIKLFSYDVISYREIELGFRIHDNVTMTDTDSDAVIIKTIASETTIQTDESTDSAAQGKNGVLYKEGGITIYVGSYQEPSSEIDFPAFELGIANDSDHAVNAYFRNFIINGQAIESAWLQFPQTSEGNAWHEFMIFDSDELSYHGITSFETVDFQLEVRTPDGVSEKIQIFNVSLSIPKSSGDEFDFIYPEITAETEDVEAETITMQNSVSEQVLADDYGIKLTAVSLGIAKGEREEITRLELLLENNTDEQLSLKYVYVAVNGVTVNASLSRPLADVIAGPYTDPGKQGACYIDIPNNALNDAGIRRIQNIVFRFDLISSYSNQAHSNYRITAQVSTAVPKSFVQVLDVGGTVLLDRDGVKVVAQGLRKDFVSDTSFVKLYIENKGDHPVNIAALDAAVNGVEIEPYTTEIIVYPGMAAYGRIEFGLDELDVSGFIAFRLQVRDADTHDVMFETDVQTLTFPK